MYQVLVVVLAVAHLVFLAYLVVGGVIALRFPRTIWLHLLTVTWAVIMIVGVVECPLTWLERWARAAGDMAPLRAEGFIAQYVTGVIYPTGAVGVVQGAVFAVILGSWLQFGWLARRRRILRET
ncbi:DUF2784 family protein [Gordonia sp. HNM0687]|uniref:DUF2784 family protein n=1 Tax=Gordonia mangrovi TaxID=2665643 RepID=A0A6L7GVY8_9ACTN|nr:DUF2784 domain-containing protein [Gordonia mangrovi]MDY6808232.1 DUF2784 domain-containing protein [Actinomycetota bacterium]MXP23637.1 DUF2784 family protein [Gordonia mangrovi]UVF79702.1 DUF2784 domain-containing protein [Gordonia mangrovi]